MRFCTGAVLAALSCLAAPLVVAAPGIAARRKAIWGPTQVARVSQFRIYDELGVGIYQDTLSWASVVPTRLADPGDAAYRSGLMRLPSLLVRNLIAGEVIRSADGRSNGRAS
jgi:hypothetical protein